MAAIRAEQKDERQTKTTEIQISNRENIKPIHFDTILQIQIGFIRRRFGHTETRQNLRTIQKWRQKVIILIIFMRHSLDFIFSFAARLVNGIFSKQK